MESFASRKFNSSKLGYQIPRSIEQHKVVNRINVVMSLQLIRVFRPQHYCGRSGNFVLKVVKHPLKVEQQIIVKVYW